MTLVCDLSVILGFFCHMPVFFAYNSHWVYEACKPYSLWERDCISACFMMLFEANKKVEKRKKIRSKDIKKFKISLVTIIKTANVWKLYSHLSISSLCPPNATTVRIAARTSSATAPALAYAVSSLLVNAEIICVEAKYFNSPIQTKPE